MAGLFAFRLGSANPLSCYHDLRTNSRTCSGHPDKHAVRLGRGFDADSPLTGVSKMAIWVTVVPHRHFPAARKTPDPEGLLRCRKALAERESVNPH
jgi:hypothetical protein